MRLPSHDLISRPLSRALLGAVTGLILGCSPGSAPAPAGSAFVDRAAEAGLTPAPPTGDRPVAHLLASTGTGVAIADHDGDGLEDLYFPRQPAISDWLAGRPGPPNALYRNQGDGTFTEVAESAGVALRGWSNGAYFVDYDNDGDKDLFVTAWGPNTLYRNEGGGRYTDVTGAAGVAGAPDAWSTSAAFGDLDRDGDLDLYVANYCSYDPRDPPSIGPAPRWRDLDTFAGPEGLPGQYDSLYRNDGDGRFTDVSAEAGLHNAPALYGLGVVMSDLDTDGDLDIFVANDRVANLLWRNEGELRFSESGVAAEVATNEDAIEQAGTGVAAGDFNGDGRVDLLVTHFSHDWNTLYGNRGELLFLDATFEAGLRDSYMKRAWGVGFLDYDNDGLLDLFTANGHSYPQVDDHPSLNTGFRQLNSLYRNRPDGTFENTGASVGSGLAIVESSRGLAVGDLDRDGAPDLVLTNLDGPPNLLMNDGARTGNWIELLLEGTESNRDAVGARIEITAGGRRQVREVNPFGSFQSQSSYAVHFGVGEQEQLDTLRIRWPSGAVDEVGDLAVNHLYRVVEGRGVGILEPTGGRP